MFWNRRWWYGRLHKVWFVECFCTFRILTSHLNVACHKRGSVFNLFLFILLVGLLKCGLRLSKDHTLLTVIWGTSFSRTRVWSSIHTLIIRFIISHCEWILLLFSLLTPCPHSIHEFIHYLPCRFQWGLSFWFDVIKVQVLHLLLWTKINCW